MAYDVKRKEKEIDDLLNRCAEAEDEGRTAHPGMNYEMGVKAGRQCRIRSSRLSRTKSVGRWMPT